MPFLTRLHLRRIPSAAQIHGMIESAFPGSRENRRLIWRVDPWGEDWHLWLVSPDKPDMTALVSALAVPGEENDSRDYDPLLSRIQAGQVWRFRLCANPVHSVNGDPNTGKRGRVHAHQTVQHQESWLKEPQRLERLGFTPLDFAVTGDSWRYFKKHGRGTPVALRAVTSDGVLRVDDAQKFRQTLVQGVGRGKAYGLGLLTISGCGQHG
jgi:CRISPR system Cascade subunit CasE